MVLRDPFCGNCGAHLVADRRSQRRSWLYWGAALVWATLMVVVLATGRYSDEGLNHVTMRQQDPASFAIIVVALVVTLVVSGLGLGYRHRRHRLAAAPAAVAVGGLLGAFSLFGLLWGVVSLGACGLLVALAGRPLRPRTPVRDGVETPGRGSISATRKRGFWSLGGDSNS